MSCSSDPRGSTGGLVGRFQGDLARPGGWPDPEADRHPGRSTSLVLGCRAAGTAAAVRPSRDLRRHEPMQASGQTRVGRRAPETDATFEETLRRHAADVQQRSKWPAGRARLGLNYLGIVSFGFRTTKSCFSSAHTSISPISSRLRAIFAASLSSEQFGRSRPPTTCPPFTNTSRYAISKDIRDLRLGFGSRFERVSQGGRVQNDTQRMGRPDRHDRHQAKSAT